MREGLSLKEVLEIDHSVFTLTNVASATIMDIHSLRVHLEPIISKRR